MDPLKLERLLLFCCCPSSSSVVNAQARKSSSLNRVVKSHRRNINLNNKSFGCVFTVLQKYKLRRFEIIGPSSTVNIASRLQCQTMSTKLQASLQNEKSRFLLAFNQGCQMTPNSEKYRASIS